MDFASHTDDGSRMSASGSTAVPCDHGNSAAGSSSDDVAESPGSSTGFPAFGGRDNPSVAAPGDNSAAARSSGPDRGPAAEGQRNHFGATGFGAREQSADSARPGAQ
ncbi:MULTISPECIES: hypothetical protein [unclassified Nocardia]|uniref:hypothetical protein n=1 Tax=unclassified Nocardia TaxID=2637762 RepID=UPI001CE40EAD|nr:MULTISPECIES: hypothetical protein [unclassified Nocardia]